MLLHSKNLNGWIDFNDPDTIIRDAVIFLHHFEDKKRDFDGIFHLTPFIDRVWHFFSDQQRVHVSCAIQFMLSAVSWTIKKCYLLLFKIVWEFVIESSCSFHTLRFLSFLLRFFLILGNVVYSYFDCTGKSIKCQMVIRFCFLVLLPRSYDFMGWTTSNWHTERLGNRSDFR